MAQTAVYCQWSNASKLVGSGVPLWPFSLTSVPRLCSPAEFIVAHDNMKGHYLTKQNHHALFIKFYSSKQKSNSQLKACLILDFNFFCVFKFREMPYWFNVFKQTPLSPLTFTIYSCWILPRRMLQRTSPGPRFAPFTKNENSIVHLKGSNRQK